MSLLTLVQDAMVLCGLESPTVVIASNDPTVAQFVALAQVAGDFEAKEHSWRINKVQGTLTGDGTDTLFDLPSDFDRMMTGNPIWMTDWLKRPLSRVTDEEMMAAKVADIEFAQPIWRLYGDQFEFYPAIDSGKVINYEYRTKKWISVAAGTSRLSRWAADDDYSLIDESLLKLSLVWRWKQSKGLDYAEPHRDWQIMRSAESFNNAAKTPIRVGRTLVHSGLATGIYGDVPPVIP